MLPVLSSRFQLLPVENKPLNPYGQSSFMFAKQVCRLIEGRGICSGTTNLINDPPNGTEIPSKNLQEWKEKKAVVETI
jgi:hypothetical protein